MKQSPFDRWLTTEPEAHAPEWEELVYETPDPCPSCEWLDGHEEGCVQLLRVWAEYQAETHVPQDIDGGPTCDERGCVICNAGTGEFADWVVAAYLDRTTDPHDPWHGFNWPSHEDQIEAWMDYKELNR